MIIKNLKKIAFIKFGGMAFGGTEKVLQTIASKLPKNMYAVDFFYCDAAPYLGSDFKHINTDPSRIDYCIKNGVNLIKFNVDFKDVRVSTHDWINTNFWNFFNEDNYDLIITGRSGHPEYPFHMINKAKIIDTIHLSGMAENKVNVFKTVLISKEQRDRWTKAGGPRKKSTIIPNPVEVHETKEKFDFKNQFVFGMHQRDDDNIFSPIPLEAYKKIESKNTIFIILGGSKKYRNQAELLGIKNIKFLPTTADIGIIHKFLNSLDVYAHGRKDGEQCSTAIIEAMSHGLPFISHIAPSMGHVEQINESGLIAKDADEYGKGMLRFIEDKNFYDTCSKKSKYRYDSIYSLDSVLEKYINIIEDVISAKNVSSFDILLNNFQNYFTSLILKIKKRLVRIKNLIYKLIKAVS